MNVKRLLLLALIVLGVGGLVGLVSIYARSRTVALTPSPNGDALIADHTVLGQFAQIPRDAIDAAAARSTLFMHQSTGDYVDQLGLGCLAGLRADPANYPRDCITFAHNRTADDGIWYNNANWQWELWDPPMADAIAKTDEFVSVVDARAGDYDVIGMKYCYVDGWNQGENVAKNYYIDHMLALESQHPDKTFIWTTSALWYNPEAACNRLLSNSCDEIARFNRQVRDYARAHNKPLFDIADIESHDANGQPCTVQGSLGRRWEGMCADWYSDSGGHPNVAGSIRLAQGFWWLMARLSGWDGD